MLTRSFVDFLRDERGSYTLWSLMWFMLYVAIGGLAVDITDAYRVQTQLQATADAAALAGVMSVGTLTQDPVQVALEYARVNMDPNINGPVLRAEDVQVGTWHFATETFFPNSTDPNAVYVRTRRDSVNDNQVVMAMLRVLQAYGWRPSWNITAEAVAVVGVNDCLNNGLIAYVDLRFNPHTNFYNYICLVGHQGFEVAGQGDSLPTFDDTVYAGVGCTAEEACVGPGSNPWNNQDFMNAFESSGPGTGNFEDGTLPLNARRVGDYIETLRAWADPDDGTFDNLGSFEAFAAAAREEFSADFEGWNYLVDTATNAWRPDYRPITAQDFAALAAQPDPLTPYTVYEITTCSNGQSFNLPPGSYDRMAIITGCRINFPSGGSYNLTDSLIATTFNGGPASISAQSDVDLVLGTTCDNGVEIYSMGDINMASGADVAGSRILANGTVHFAANADGDAGIHIEAMGSIDPASGGSQQATGESNWGLCDGIRGKGPMVLTYVLLR